MSDREEGVVSEDRALRKLRDKIAAQDREANRAWSEAISIPAGCGCTPFYADARAADEKLIQLCRTYDKRAGRKALENLRFLRVDYLLRTGKIGRATK